MFESLAKHRHIFVAGPHRSGTTICARMIAHDTGHDLLIEDEFEFANLMMLATFLQSKYSSVVVQCPFLSDVIHDLSYLIDVDMEDALVVFMHRYRQDIISSEDRSRVNFEGVGEKQKGRYHTTAEEHISDIRYEAWQDQCVAIPHAIDVSYESLSDHNLWIEDRSELPFGHEIAKAQLPRVFIDGIISAANV